MSFRWPWIASLLVLIAIWAVVDFKTSAPQTNAPAPKTPAEARHTASPATGTPPGDAPLLSGERLAAAQQTWPYLLGPCTIISNEQWQAGLEAIRAANRQGDFSLLRVLVLQAPPGDLCREGQQRPRLNLLAMTAQHLTLAQMAQLLAEGIPPSPDLLLGAAQEGKERLQFLIERGVPFSDPSLQEQVMVRLMTYRNLEGLRYVTSLGFDIRDRDGSKGWLLRVVRQSKTLLAPEMVALLIQSGSRLSPEQFDQMPVELQQQLLIMAESFGQPLIAETKTPG